MVEHSPQILASEAKTTTRNGYGTGRVLAQAKPQGEFPRGRNSAQTLCPTKVLRVRIPTGSSPSRGGDVAVYVVDINQPSLPTPFYSVLVSISVLWSFELYFIP